MNILGFEHMDGRHTTTGEPNKKTGRYNIAGSLHSFKTFEDREIWLSNWARKRTPCTKRQARSYFEGMTVRDFDEMVSLVQEFS